MPNRLTERGARIIRAGAGVALTVVIGCIGFTHGVLYVQGASMRPALWPGDLILYRRGTDSLEIGDLVVFEHGGPVVHRVASVLGGGVLRTQGDANASADPTPVEADVVWGEVVGVLPVGRMISAAAAGLW